MAKDAGRILFTQVFKGNNGVAALRLIMELSGYDVPNVIRTGESIDEKAMLINEGRRQVWLEMRQFIIGDVLKRVEIDPFEKAVLSRLKPEEKKDGRSSSKRT